MDSIRTERLLLRPAREDDLAAIHLVLSDPIATRYWYEPPHTSLEQTREWLAGMIASPPDESFDFLVEHEGEVIGKAGFHRLPVIGYILRPDHWGKGLATEALSVVIEQAFARFDIPSIEADIDPRNLASIRLVERLGFTVSGRAERTWQVGDEWCDSVYYELKRP